MFFLSHLIYSFSVIYGNTQSLFYELFYELILNPKLEYDDMIIQEGAYQLIIANLNNRKSPRDTKVKDTIMSIVEEFFDKNQVALLYICSTGDGKQAMRSRLFGHWFEGSNTKLCYSTMSTSLVDADGVVNEATIIVRNDNPNMIKLINEFSETAQLLSQKP